jgi:nucleotide-binding universal stress UspA family protein
MRHTNLVAVGSAVGPVSTRREPTATPAPAVVSVDDVVEDAVTPPFARPLVPVAHEDDAVATARAALPYLVAAGGRPTVVNVIEKAGGAPDKASVEGRELAAEEAFAAFRERAAATGVDVDTEIRYGTDVVATLLDAADERDCSAVVFVPRGGRNVLFEFLTGDVRDRLVTESDRPVVVLPDREPDGSGDADGDADADGEGEGA